jgi:putative DNA primase/helicase
MISGGRIESCRDPSGAKEPLEDVVPARSLQCVEEALSYVPSDDRSLWIRVGRVLHDAYGDAGFDLWDAWSQRAMNYQGKAAQQAWSSFRRPGQGLPATLGTIFHHAKEYGFRFEERHAADRQAAHAIRHVEADRDLEYRAAAAEAKELLDRAIPAHTHPYLGRKGIQAHGTYLLDAWPKKRIGKNGKPYTLWVKNPLLVPIWSGRGELASLQAIFPHAENALGRDKDYLTGGRKRGCYHLIGTGSADGTILICEGFATGASLHEATGWPVLVGFDAGNLSEIARRASIQAPQAQIIIAADNDVFNKPQPHGRPNNPGLQAATRAAREVRALLAVPAFGDLKDRPTDNDLHRQEGLEALRTGGMSEEHLYQARSRASAMAK